MGLFLLLVFGAITDEKFFSFSCQYLQIKIGEPGGFSQKVRG
jgi:hypothetical protein